MHKCHESEVGIEPTISEVAGASSDDCATWPLMCRVKQSYTRNLHSPCSLDVTRLFASTIYLVFGRAQLNVFLV